MSDEERTDHGPIDLRMPPTPQEEVVSWGFVAFRAVILLCGMALLTSGTAWIIVEMWKPM
jgi:hypothetical protein